MIIFWKLSEFENVDDVLVMMGMFVNKLLLEIIGFWYDDFYGVMFNDICVVICIEVVDDGIM